MYFLFLHDILDVLEDFILGDCLDAAKDGHFQMIIIILLGFIAFSLLFRGRRR